MFALKYTGIRPRFGAKIIDYGPYKEIETAEPTSMLGRAPVGPTDIQIVCNNAPQGQSQFEEYTIECGTDQSAELSLSLLRAKSDKPMLSFVSQYGLPYYQYKFDSEPSTTLLLSHAIQANKQMIECQTLLLPQFANTEDGQWKLLEFMNFIIPRKSNEARLDWRLDRSGQLIPIIQLKNPFTFALFEMFTARHYGRGIHTCPNCNQFFTAGKTANNKTKWCSPACRQSSYRKRKNL